VNRRHNQKYFIYLCTWCEYKWNHNENFPSAAMRWDEMFEIWMFEMFLPSPDFSTGKPLFPNKVGLPCKKWRGFFEWGSLYFSAVVPSFRDLFHDNFVSFPTANLRRCSHRFYNLFGNKDQSLPKHSYSSLVSLPSFSFRGETKIPIKIRTKNTVCLLFCKNAWVSSTTFGGGGHGWGHNGDTSLKKPITRC